MCRKLIFLISVVLVLGLLNGASADTFTWTGEAADNNSWCNGDNWDGGEVPGSSDTALIDWSSPERGPIIGIGCNANVDGIQGPEPNFGMVQVMDVNTDGTVKVGEGGWMWRRDVEGVGTGTAIININGNPWITIDGLWRGTDNGISIVNIDGDPCIIVTGDYRGGDNSGWFCTNMSGGYFEIGDEFIIGDNGGGEINVSGGTIVVDHLGMGGDRGTAAITINMTGGLILVEGEFMFPGSAGRAGNIWMNLDGGVMDCNEFLHGGEDGDDPTYTDDWRVDIEQGVLKISGDVVDIIDANVVAGQITAYDGEGTVVVVYDDVNDKTVVSGLPPDPNTATDPNPGNHSTGVDPNVVLSWTAGVNATDHLVFFGTSFDDVETMTDPCAIRPDDCNYYPGPLCKGTTYYWRIDANNPTTTWTGRIWCFTVKSPIVDPNMLVYYKFDEPNGIVAYDSSGRGYHGVVDGNELLWDPDNGHRDGSRIFDDDGDGETLVDVPAAVTSTIDGGITISVWLKDAYNDDEENWVCNIGAGGEGAPYHLLVDVGGGYERAYFRAGNDSCDVLTWDLDGRDARDIEEWHHWAFVKDENIDTMSMYFDGELVASNTATNDTLAFLQNTTFKIGASTWEYYAFAGAMDEFKVFDYGLSEKEVQALFREEGLEFAWKPHPYDGEKEVAYDVVLEWSPGDYATSHEVYFGTNWDDINDVNNSNLASYPNVDYNHVEVCSYDPPGFLDLDTIYYWRVDEVNDTNNDTWKGRVWKFTVAEYITVDDMEDYTPLGGSHDIYAGWIDGGYNSTGSYLFLQTVTPVRGEQSMKYVYDNTFDWFTGYYYSEIETVNLDPNDWTDFNVKVLTLWFYGKSGNDANDTEQMYVGIEDSDGNYAEVKYGDSEDEDMNDIRVEEWQDWEILLSEFNDVNLARLEKMFIGFGIRYWIFPGGGGLDHWVHFDDIRLYPPTCRPDKVKSEADLNNDCIVDFGDVEIMAEEWLDSDVNIGVVEAPDPCVLHYKFDESSGSSVTDYSTNNYDGVVMLQDRSPTDAFWEPDSGMYGGCIRFEHKEKKYCVDVPNDVFNNHITNKITISVWVSWDDPETMPDETNQLFSVHGGPAADYNEILGIKTHWRDKDGKDEQVRFWDANEDNEIVYGVNDGDWSGGWNHYAFVKDVSVIPGKLRIYHDGQLVKEGDSNSPMILPADNAWLGMATDEPDGPHDNYKGEWHDEYTGLLDDFRIYNYALSETEIGYLASGGTGIVTVQSVANLYNKEDLGERAVNLRDYAELAKSWLEKKLWPQ